MKKYYLEWVSRNYGYEKQFTKEVDYPADTIFAYDVIENFGSPLHIVEVDTETNTKTIIKTVIFYCERTEEDLSNGVKINTYIPYVFPAKVQPEPISIPSTIADRYEIVNGPTYKQEHREKHLNWLNNNLFDSNEGNTYTIIDQEITIAEMYRIQSEENQPILIDIPTKSVLAKVLFLPGYGSHGDAITKNGEKIRVNLEDLRLVKVNAQENSETKQQ